MAQVSIPQEKKIAINDAIERIFRSAGIHEHSLGFSFADQIDASQTTVSDLTLYVDPVNGSDSNPGNSQFPFQTIQAALNSVPKVIRHTVTITVTAGTCYADLANPNMSTLNVSGFIIDPANNQASLTIQGSTSVYQATIAATGMTTSLGIFTVSVSGTPFTVNAFKGKFLYAVSGSGSGSTLYPVIDNTTSSVRIAAANSPGFNATTQFQIVDLATTISDEKNGVPGQYAYNGPLCIQGCVGTTIDSAKTPSAGIFIKNFVLYSSATTGYNSVIMKSCTGVEVQSCVLSSPSILAFCDNLHDCAFVGNTVPTTNTAAGFSYHVGYSQTADSSIRLWGNVFTASAGSFCQLLGYILTQGNYIDSGTADTYWMGEEGHRQCHISSFNDTVNCNGTAVYGGTSTGAGYNSVSLISCAFTGTAGLAKLKPMMMVDFNANITIASSNFISLDGGTTWSTKASIEAAPGKCLSNTTYLTLAREKS